MTTILGAIAAQTGSFAYAVDGTRIVGEADDTAAHAVLWNATSPATAPIILGAIGGQTASFALGVSGNYIVGEADDPVAHGVLWDALNPTNAPTILGAIGGQVSSSAIAVSGTRIVGWAQDSSFHAVLWDATNPTAAPTLLGAIAGQTGSQAFGLDGTHIVGYADNATSPGRAAVWTTASPTSAPTLLGVFGGPYQFFAQGVAGNYVVGQAIEPSANDPVFWDLTAPTVAVRLGGTGSNLAALGVNGTTIVGQRQPIVGDQRAVKWDATNPTGVALSYDPIPNQTAAVANAISSSYVVGQAADTQTHAVIFTFTPLLDETVTIGGNVIPNLFRVGESGPSLIRIEVTAPGVATATIKVIDLNNAFTFADNDAVVITDPTTPGKNAFQGVVQRRTINVVATYRVWDLYCADLNTWLDQILVGVPDGTQFLEDPPGTFTPYDPLAVTAASDSLTVQNLFGNYANFLGIDTVSFVETLVTNLASKPVRWHTVTLRSALNDVVGLVNNAALRYWIDADAQLHWTVRTLVPPITTGSAPGPLLRLFPTGSTIVPTATLTDSAPQNNTTIFNYENMTVEYDDSGWADLIYVNGATTFTETRTYIVQYLGGGLYQPWTGTDNVYPTGLVVNQLFTCLGTLQPRTIAAVPGVDDAWLQTWRTGNVAHPNGIRYDPATPDVVYVVDGGTRTIYTVRQSDRAITDSVYIGKIIPHPLGLSSDPGDAAIYWVLNAPWGLTGVLSGNFIAKCRKSDNAVIATYSLPNGRWSDIKVSASYIWLTNIDTDRLHKYDKSSGTQIASYVVSYGGGPQVNPTGLYVDGTTLGVFFLSHQRFLRVDESDPTTVVSVQSTAGYSILGGEIDTTTHADLYSNTNTLVLKFNLKTAGTPASTIDYAVVNEPGSPTFDKYWLPLIPGRASISNAIYAEEVGGSGWVNDISPTVAIGGQLGPPIPQPRQRLLTSNVSTSEGTRDSIGAMAVAASGAAVVRGSCAVYVTFGGWEPGQVLTIVSVPGMLNGDFMVQKVTTEFLSGRGDRKIQLEWGNAPVGTIGLRRGAQIPPGTLPRRPAQRMEVTVSNSAPGAGGELRVTAQAVDQSGNPWPIEGKTVTWDFRAFDADANEISAVASVTFNPTTSTTNLKGEAWTDVTLDTRDATTYYFSASMIV